MLKPKPKPKPKPKLTLTLTVKLTVMLTLKRTKLTMWLRNDFRIRPLRFASRVK